MKEILIASGNSYKQKRLAEIVDGFFIPKIISLDPVDETGETFKEIAENKAIEYSLKYNCLAISTDGGAVIPALDKWNPLRTRRFGNTDEERINELLKLMSDKEDRTVEWHEALAVADNGRLIFSVQERAMDGVISKSFDPAKYEDGIWLCSITDFPEFENRNYFDLNSEEKARTEDSWSKLKERFVEFFSNK